MYVLGTAPGYELSWELCTYSSIINIYHCLIVETFSYVSCFVQILSPVRITGSVSLMAKENPLNVKLCFFSFLPWSFSESSVRDITRTTGTMVDQITWDHILLDPD